MLNLKVCRNNEYSLINTWVIWLNNPENIFPSWILRGSSQKYLIWQRKQKLEETIFILQQHSHLARNTFPSDVQYLVCSQLLKISINPDSLLPNLSPRRHSFKSRKRKQFEGLNLANLVRTFTKKLFQQAHDVYYVISCCGKIH